MQVESVISQHDGGYILNGNISVPPDSHNRHYQMIQEWVAAGNTPESGPEMDPKDEKIAAQKQAALEATIKSEVRANPAKYPDLATDLGIST